MSRGAGCTFRVTNGVSDDLLGAEQSQESSYSWDQFLFVSLYTAAAYDIISLFNGVQRQRDLCALTLISLGRN